MRAESCSTPPPLSFHPLRTSGLELVLVVRCTKWNFKYPYILLKELSEHTKAHHSSPSCSELLLSSPSHRHTSTLLPLSLKRYFSVHTMLVATPPPDLALNRAQNDLSRNEIEPALSSSDNGPTLAERRQLGSTEKLSLQRQSSKPTLARLEEANAALSPQASEEYLLACLERRPRSELIDCEGLDADFLAIMADEQQRGSSAIDWDFWRFVIDDFKTAATQLPHLLTTTLLRSGIPDCLRGVVWRAMSQASTTHLESLYETLTHEPSTPYDRVIERDLSRTYPQIDLFRTDGGEGQLAMGRLLKAYSIYDAHVGYCQGLAFLVGPLLMKMSEKDAFCVFVRLMETYGMRTMFTLNMEGLHLRLHQFSVLLQELCPELSAHLVEHGLHPAMYASQWFLTLFAYTLPIDLVFRIYDLVFAEGAIETITRLAVAVMLKNQKTLLEIRDFECLMMYLSSRKLYEEAFDSPNAVIEDTMALSTIITRAKVDAIHLNKVPTETIKHQIEQHQQQQPQQQLQQPKRSAVSKRESWFGSWRRTSGETHAPPANLTSPTSPSFSSLGNGSSSNLSITSHHHQHNSDQVVLHQQIEDLVMALSQLQKDHSKLSQEMVATKMEALNRDTERLRLIKRNEILEKRIRKYKSKLASPKAPIQEQEEEEEEEEQQDREFSTFVDSLRMSGDFGALVAGALATPPMSSEEKELLQQQRSSLTTTTATHPGMAATGVAKNDGNSGDAEDDLTDELVNYKLAHEELKQRFDALSSQYSDLMNQKAAADAKTNSLASQLEMLQSDLEAIGLARDQLLEEQEEIEQENHDMEEKLLAAKKTSAELQSEKLALVKQVEALEKRVMSLEQEKREYLMPRGSFSEEVFAVHHTLFGSNEQQQKQQQVNGHHKKDVRGEYEQKFVESELHCRELEKLLAETKFKLAEYEAGMATSPIVSSHRLSQPPPPRRRSMRNSLLSTMSMPSTPSFEPRESTDSIGSYGSKRSSMYSRLFTAQSITANSSTTTPASSVAIKSPVLSSSRPEDLTEEELRRQIL
ncbi:rab-GTPase-TBC domain-containing protein [Dichotomocladium elegans]|nr:rab-GTPase-TBC domain-containing protein [Dichotomocladium elegans]